MIFVLILSDMRFSRIEESDNIVAWADNPQVLEEFLKQERTEPYDSNGWSKSFKEGGPLEWCNASSWSYREKVIKELETPEEYSERLRREAFEQRSNLLNAVKKIS